MTIIEKLKANLLEIIYSLDDYSLKDIFERLSLEIKNTLDATIVVFFMVEKWNIEKQVNYYSSHYPISGLINTPPQKLMNLFNDHSNIILIEKETIFTERLKNKTNYLMKLHELNDVEGFALISFNDHQIDNNSIEKIRQTIEQFIRVIQYNERQRILNEHNSLLFQLSTKLHSIHQTTEVLKRVYRTMQKLYPSFQFCFLMVQEYERCSVPIKMIEYTGDVASSPGTKAYITNEIQVTYHRANNITNVYSPLSGKQGVYGVIQVVIPQIIGLVESEIRFVKRLTDMVGRAIERTTLYQSSNKLITDLQVINVASHDLNSKLEKNEITNNVKKHIMKSCQAEQFGIIFFNNEDENKKEAYTIGGGSTSFFWTETGKNFVEYVIQKLDQDPKPVLSGDFKINQLNVPFRSMMIFPLWSSEELLGVIIIAHEFPYFFSFDKYKLIQSFVQHASLAFTNSMLKEKLRKTAITDYLTKLYSRNHIDKIIDQDMKNNHCGSIVLFDVDDFKQINDLYGHYVGDRVLIQVANIIKSFIEGDEVAARWGGEEFALYFPNSTIQYATKKANMIREKVINQTNPNVSLSCGVSNWDKKESDTIERLFIRADQALYKAKSLGKNRVVIK